MSIQVYGFGDRFASFRVRVALRLKGLPFEETRSTSYPANNSSRVMTRSIPSMCADFHS